MIIPEIPMRDPSPDRKTLELQACGKLNLALAVGPARELEPGRVMHPIASWMVPISLADDLLLTRLEADRLSRYAIRWAEDAPVKTPIDWSITKDLAVRAHLALEQEVGRPLPLQLKLKKRLPVGGGLGGGSADAAAMLRGVRQLFQLEVTDDRLAALAAELGADVRFFLGAGPALVEGCRGEQLAPTPPLHAAAILVLPEFGCNTARVYQAFDEGPAAADEAAFAERAGQVRSAAQRGQLHDEPLLNDAGRLLNDLAAPAQTVAPQLGKLLQSIEATAKRPAHITGSGSGCFVLVREGEDAAAPAAELRAALPQCAVAPVQIGGQ